MNYRLAFVVSLLLLAGSLIMNVPGRIAVAQDAEAAKPGVGRFQNQTTVHPAGTIMVVVCDTQTGQCWLSGSPKKWVDFGSPMDK
jgi:hypothetical protein